MMRNLAILLCAGIVTLACHSQTSVASDSAAAPTSSGSTTAAVATSGPRIVLPDGFSERVEIAADDETRAQGLMYRDRVVAGTGMIFVFPQAGDYPFWMKNTLVPLDMIWLDASKKIVHLESNVPPCKADPCPSYPAVYPPNAAARYVLELGAGEAARHGVATGKTLEFHGLDDVFVR